MLLVCICLYADVVGMIALSLPGIICSVCDLLAPNETPALDRPTQTLERLHAHWHKVSYDAECTE